MKSAISMTTKLNTEPNIETADDFYEKLIEMHQGLSDEQSRAVNARLVLLLANHIGDPKILQEAMDRAKANETGADDAKHST